MYVVLHIQCTIDIQFYPNVGSDNKFHLNFTISYSIKIHSVVLKLSQVERYGNHTFLHISENGTKCNLSLVQCQYFLKIGRLMESTLHKLFLKFEREREYYFIIMWIK
jgi:hypothetical protein